MRKIFLLNHTAEKLKKMKRQGIIRDKIVNLLKRMNKKRKKIVNVEI